MIIVRIIFINPCQVTLALFSLLLLIAHRLCLKLLVMGYTAKAGTPLLELDTGWSLSRILLRGRHDGEIA